MLKSRSAETKKVKIQIYVSPVDHKHLSEDSENIVFADMMHAVSAEKALVDGMRDISGLPRGPSRTGGAAAAFLSRMAGACFGLQMSCLLT